MTIDELLNTLNKQPDIVSGKWHIHINRDLKNWYINVYNIVIANAISHFDLNIKVNNNNGYEVYEMSRMIFVIMELTNKIQFDNISNISNYLIKLREEINNAESN